MTEEEKIKKLKQAVDLLLETEFINTDYFGWACAWCYHESPGHDETCERQKAIELYNEVCNNENFLFSL